MLQELIVYLILILTAVHLLLKSIDFFKPVKANSKGPGCASGSCSNCSLKIDFDSIQPGHKNHHMTNEKYIKINKCH